MRITIAQDLPIVSHHRYGKRVSSELRVVLHGDAGEQDAARLLDSLSKMLGILRALEGSTADHITPQPSPTVWRFNRLGLGSLDAGFAPLQLAEGVDEGGLVGVLEQAVEGFDRAEHEQALPTAWQPSAVRSAAEIAEGLANGMAQSMTLTVISNGQEIRTVEVTGRAARGFRVALQPRHTSLGSVTGTLDSINLHERQQAGLWSERTGRRVAVTFEARHLGDIRNLLTRRVEVWGECRRNAFGDLLSVKLMRYEVLPDDADEFPLAELVGLAPGVGDDSGNRHPNGNVE